MVSFSEIQASNSRITSSLPNLVAVFAGATSGIGEATLKQFAKHTTSPRIYYVGRSQEAGDRIFSELTTLNPEGEYLFIKADLSLIRTVDDVCRDIKAKEKTINLLFLTIGTLVSRTETSEGLQRAITLAYYSRARIMQNLLPQLQASTSLRRIVTVFAGTKEGPITTCDFQGRNVPLLSSRGHTASMVTFSLEALAARAPEVSFIHCYPGFVKTNIGRDMTGLINVMKVVLAVIGPLIYVPIEESGARHLFLATSDRYPAGSCVDGAVRSSAGVDVAIGSNGDLGSGVYAVSMDGESARPKVVEFLGNLRKEGMVEKVWAHTEGEFKRITRLGAM